MKPCTTAGRSSVHSVHEVDVTSAKPKYDVGSRQCHQKTQHCNCFACFIYTYPPLVKHSPLDEKLELQPRFVRACLLADQEQQRLSSLEISGPFMKDPDINPVR